MKRNFESWANKRIKAKVFQKQAALLPNVSDYFEKQSHSGASACENINVSSVSVEDLEENHSGRVNTDEIKFNDEAETQDTDSEDEGKRKLDRRETRISMEIPETTKKKYAINPKFRFKAAVRLVMAHLIWMGAAQDDESTNKDDFASTVRRIRRRKGPLSLLTYHEKMILMKHHFVRTEQEIQELTDAFSKVRCFKQYGTEIHTKLARTAEFFCFGANREVMRLYAPATGIYLITSGEVSILQERMDTSTLTTYFVPVGSIGPGEMIGEVSLLYDLPRICTFVTMAVCEMVFWDKEKFEEVLLEAIQKDSIRMLQILMQFSYFKDWNENALRVCSTKSNIGKYPRHTTIRARGVGEKYFLHVVLRGECHVIHRLDMVHGMTKKGTPFIPYPYDGREVPPGRVVKTHFFNIARFRRGMVFNLGESWKNRMILAHTDVVIFLVPIELVEEFGSKDNTWELIRIFIKNQLPDKKNIYYEYCQKIKWVKYREKLMENIIERHRDPTNTRIRD